MGNKNFMDYFTYSEEYPKDIAENILPWGTMWEYVSSTFLNGFINYVTIVKAFVLNRYTQWNEGVDEISLMDPQNSFTWAPFNGTKEELYNHIFQHGGVYHTDLGMFNDDVIILAECSQGKYYFFWFDCDVSDCQIGRFKTTDPRKVVIKSFEDHIKGIEFRPVRELPLHFFEGWMKF